VLVRGTEKDSTQRPEGIACRECGRHDSKDCDANSEIVGVLVALMNAPWKRTNSEKNPFVAGSPTMARNPMNAAVAVIGILEASPPSFLILLSP